MKVYHGTSASAAEAILMSELTPGLGTHPAMWFMVTDSPGQAAGYGEVVIEFDLPGDPVWSRTNRDGLLWRGHEHDVYGYKATAYALRKPIPGDLGAIFGCWSGGNE